MQGRWNAWVHLGRSRRASPSWNSPRQTEQSQVPTIPSPLTNLISPRDLISDSSSPPPAGE
ncbi:unnamed protein product [Spirodela intermedia]|uniref:Uncharacterized protein n=2 Tax=Spirodela intermedia TaxID=51605 RepID=A0A7I8JIC3_SPIIN|nr:unnamed protein product [Spirodela intermedia]CAA6669671.1 unnamed protein product [Spirodela intermedia]CAA7406640.1 unnamed protein product [Spirodela intermedia]